MTPFLPAPLEAELRARVARGSLLFHLALSEALAGDAVGERLDPAAVGGWAVDVGADGYEVAALGLGERPQRLLRVTFAADGRPIVEAAQGEATPRQRGLARAREAAARRGAALGGRWLAIAVPPPLAAEPDRLDAYLLRLGETGDELVLGPHWRLVVGGDDGAVLAQVPVGAPGEEVAPTCGRTPVALEHADVLPSEVHVMLSLRHATTLEVRTPGSGARWLVDGEAVRRLPPQEG